MLPVLKHFSFKGVGEYLDDLVAHIDAPRLIKLYITLLDKIEFNTPQFIRFISHTPTLKPLKEACVIFRNGYAGVRLSSPFQELYVSIPCRGLDWQVSSLEQVCTSCLPPFPALEELYIYGDSLWERNRQDHIENWQWLELLRPFTTVKNLYLSEEFAPHIVPALQVLVEIGTPEVLPALQNIFREGLKASGPVHEGIWQFVAPR